MTDTSGHEVYEHLLMQAVDGLISEEDKRTLHAHLEVCEQCRAEMTDFRLIKEDTDMLSQRIFEDARIEPARETALQRRAVGLGTLLATAAITLIVGFGAYELATDPSAPMLIRVALGLGTLAGLIFFAIVLFGRLRAAGSDPYREIDQ